jgi:hypothetical protein
MKTKLLYLFVLLSGITIAQNEQKKITGTVKSKNGESLIGAIVHIIGTNESATTDTSGNFSLSTTKLPPFKIQVSYVGYSSLIQDINDLGLTYNKDNKTWYSYKTNENMSEYFNT